MGWIGPGYVLEYRVTTLAVALNCSYWKLKSGSGVHLFSFGLPEFNLAVDRRSDCDGNIIQCRDLAVINLYLHASAQGLLSEFIMSDAISQAQIIDQP
jgi:hypothetical protein